MLYIWFGQRGNDPNQNSKHREDRLKACPLFLFIYALDFGKYPIRLDKAKSTILEG